MILRAYPEADKKDLQDVVDGHTCECNKWARARHRPVVRMPKEPHFNDSVAIDLVFVGGLVVFHAICLFTRFSAARLMPTKAAADSEQAFVEAWISLHGPPREVLTDLGTEFDNAGWRRMADSMGMRLGVTPGDAHWANGVVERRNNVLRGLLLRNLEDSEVAATMALASVVLVINCMVNVYGYSPYQLVYRRLPPVCLAWTRTRHP